MRESKRNAKIVYSTVPVEPDSKFKVSFDYDREPNSTIAAAQLIEAPVEIYGTASETDDNTVSDYYKINLTAGQRLEVILIAGVLGSTLHPVVTIRNSGGTSVGTVTNLFDGAYDQHGTYTAASAGSYYIRVATGDGTDLKTSFYRLLVSVH